MTANLTCAQVRALLPFYIDDKLTSHLKSFVEAHLAVCPTCKQKYDALKDMIKTLRDAHKKVVVENQNNNNKSLSPKLSDELAMNLSAYVDNELDEIESIKVKKNIISNPQIRKSVENLYVLKKILAGVFEKEKENVKEDYSKLIFDKIDLKEEVYADDGFFKVFFILTSCLTMLMIVTLVLFLHW